MLDIPTAAGERSGGREASNYARMARVARPVWQWGAAHALVWLVLLVVGVVAGHYFPQTIWNYSLIPESFHTGLASYGGLSLLPLSMLVSTLVSAPSLIRHSPDSIGESRLLSYAIRGTCTGLAGLLIMLYGASWASFYSTGQFLGAGGMTLWLGNPLQLMQHVLDLEPALLLTVPLAAGLGTALIVGGISLFLRSATLTACRITTLLSLLLMMVCALSAFSSQSLVDELHMYVRDPSVGAHRNFVDVYAVARRDRTDPVAHAIATIIMPERQSRAIPSVPITVPVETRPLIPIDQYRKLAQVENTRRWNVVVLVVESLRSSELLEYGGQRLVMPNVEQLTQDSRVFTKNVTTATHSDYASVVPLSGQYPLRSPDEQQYTKAPSYPRVLIYDILKSLGYHTAVFSSQNEYWGGMYYFLNTGNIDHFFHAETYHGDTYVPSTDGGFASWVSKGRHAGKIDDRITVTAATQWLDSLYRGARSSEPFFMYVNLQSSHVPYQRPSDFRPRFGPGSTSFAIGFNHFPPDSADAVHDMYDNSLAYLDSQVGRLVGYLKNRGLWDNTIFVLTGDHGQAFYEHGFAAHGNVPYAELARAPLIIHAPGLSRGLDDRPSQHVDVPPTVLSLLGLPPHPAFQGIDLTGPRPPDDRPLFVVAQTPNSNSYSIVNGQYTLILDDFTGLITLYDDEADPAQKRDISRTHRALRDSLLHELDMWRRVQLTYYAHVDDSVKAYPPSLVFWNRPNGNQSLAGGADLRRPSNQPGR